MHTAPKIVVLVRSVFGIGWAIVCLAALAMSVVYFAASHHGTSHTLGLLLLVCVTTTALASFGWWKAPVGLLTWNEQHWSFGGFGADPVCSAHVHYDLQRMVIVELRSRGGAASWICLTQQQIPREWMALRRALFTKLATPQAAVTP